MGLGRAIAKIWKGKPAPVDYVVLWRVMKNLPERQELTVSADMWFSPSQLASMCHRAYALAAYKNVPIVKEFDVNSRWRMDLGTGGHAVAQDLWVGPTKMLLGGWRCPSCGKVDGVSPDDSPVWWRGGERREKVTLASSLPLPKECRFCHFMPSGAARFSFVEPLLFDKYYKVSGRCDGFLHPSIDVYEVVDFKFVGTLYHVRRNPYPQHIIQLFWYMWMAKVYRGRIIYIDRTAKKFRDAWVEHSIEFDDYFMDSERRMLNDLRNCIQEREQFQGDWRQNPRFPVCRYGGKSPYGGPCECVALEASGHGHGH